MIVCDHNIPTDTSSDDVASAVLDDKHDLEALLFFVVTTVACDSGGEGACAGSKIHDFGAVEDDYLLVFVGREGRRGGRGPFSCFTFVVFFPEGPFTLLLAEYRNRTESEMQC